MRKASIGTFRGGGSGLSDLRFGPAQHRRRDADRAIVLTRGDRLIFSRIARRPGEARQHLRLPHIFGNLEAVLFEQPEQFAEYVNIRKSLASANEYGFDRLLRGLLRIEAQVFKIPPWDARLGAGEVCARSIQPFARIVGRQALLRHRLPSLL
jgi:hypothetical protein